MGMNSPSRGSRASLSEINITPLVDVMLVLLIIFMVTAPMMQQGLEIDLPEVESTGVSTNDKPFVLTIKKNGRLYIGKVEVQAKALRKKIKAIFKTRKNKQVYIKADKKAYYGAVAKAMGEVRAAGISNISLISLPLGSR
ncbi:MAG: protein TolR [Bdellovibrionaceae bacterium]|jgi:biopolymer transport protein TolR|nr:protein TolR [Pseudobdellovibrionaceae bacterium]